MLASVAFDAGIISSKFYTTLVLAAVLTSQLAGDWLDYVLAQRMAAAQIRCSPTQLGPSRDCAFCQLPPSRASRPESYRRSPVHQPTARLTGNSRGTAPYKSFHWVSVAR